MYVQLQPRVQVKSVLAADPVTNKDVYTRNNPWSPNINKQNLQTDLYTWIFP